MRGVTEDPQPGFMNTYIHTYIHTYICTCSPPPPPKRGNIFTFAQIGNSHLDKLNAKFDYYPFGKCRSMCVFCLHVGA